MAFHILGYKSGEIDEFLQVGSKTAQIMPDNHPLDGGLTWQGGNSSGSTNRLMIATKICLRWAESSSPFCNRGVVE